ncbi:MAG TPA: hypothetical protein VEW03_04735 [Longimicrobiaceae bacterium]|nr:hypothetical protein [Longimicrobiaceae bacterium]
MRRRLMLFAAGAVVIAALVWAAGAAMAPPADRRGVTAGVAVGLGFQLLLVAVTTAALPRSRMAAYGLGMLGRFVLVVAAALAIVPATGLPPVPMLLSLVTVLFATTLLEPVLFAAGAHDEKVR